MLGIHRNSLSYKTTILYIVLGVIIVSAFNFIIWENQSDLLVDNQKWFIETQCTNLRTMIEENLVGDQLSDREKIYREIEASAAGENVIYTYVYSEGAQLMFQSEGEAPEIDLDREIVLINRSVARYELENKKFLHYTELEKGVINLYLPISILDGTEMLIFKFVSPLLELTERKNQVLKICLLVAAFIALLQILMAFVIRWWIIKPINHLVNVTMEVGKGDLQQRSRINQNDEIGTLSGAYNQMVKNLDKMQKEAKGANPLSGLPGNISIMNTIDTRLGNGEKIAIIYGDLDNFKAYNDKYGLTKGDEAILHCRDVFVDAVEQANAPDCFIGHEGGDDFVIVCPFKYWEDLCKRITDLFDKGVPRFYNEEHNRQGYIDAKDRMGNPVQYPLMAISLAVVSNHYRSVQDHRILIAWAAEMKKVAKKKEGSSYAIDIRRR